MLVRIVKLNIQTNKIEAFLESFEKIKHEIRNFEGNEFLELYQDHENKNLFFTYSYWDNEESLNKYRNSTFFNEVWTYTKTLFADKPEAWSVNKLVSLN